MGKGRSGNMYTLDLVVKKGKAKVKGTVKPAPSVTPKPPKPPPTGSGSGSGSGSGGGASGPACSCVASKQGGGSGPGTPPPSGSGSGSESPPGSGSGSGETGGTGGGNGGGNGGECTYPADHTMTLYPGPADVCGDDLKFSGLDDATKKALLDKHNELRQKVASGGEAGQPGANMRKLVWDDELETIAQRW